MDSCAAILFPNHRCLTVRPFLVLAVTAALNACSPSSKQGSDRTPLSDAARQELTALHDQDQADRSIGPSQLAHMTPHQVDSLSALVDQRDAARRARVRDLMQLGVPVTAVDYYHAAVVMQHGSGAADYANAHEWAEGALTLDPGDQSARYLFAASWDRLMLSQQKPQWYGTSVERGPDGNGALSAIDTTQVTDSVRQSYTGWTLSQRRAFVEDMNKRVRP